VGDARAGSFSMGKLVLLGYSLEYHGVYIYICYICIYKYNIYIGHRRETMVPFFSLEVADIN
jgi:hypothetical protein